jgi:hypothetical protein
VAAERFEAQSLTPTRPPVDPQEADLGAEQLLVVELHQVGVLLEDVHALAAQVPVGLPGEPAVGRDGSGSSQVRGLRFNDAPVEAFPDTSIGTLEAPCHIPRDPQLCGY